MTFVDKDEYYGEDLEAAVCAMPTSYTEEEEDEEGERELIEEEDTFYMPGTGSDELLMNGVGEEMNMYTTEIIRYTCPKGNTLEKRIGTAIGWENTGKANDIFPLDDKRYKMRQQ